MVEPYYNKIDKLLTLLTYGTDVGSLTTVRPFVRAQGTAT